MECRDAQRRRGESGTFDTAALPARCEPGSIVRHRQLEPVTALRGADDLRVYAEPDMSQGIRDSVTDHVLGEGLGDERGHTRTSRAQIGADRHRQSVGEAHFFYLEILTQQYKLRRERDDLR